MNASTYKISYTYIFWFFIYLFINSLITRNNCENDNFFYISLVKMFTRLSHLNCNIKWNCSEPPARKHMIQLNIVYFCYLFFTHFYSSSQSFGVGSFSFFILFFVIFLYSFCALLMYNFLRSNYSRISRMLKWMG